MSDRGSAVRLDDATKIVAGEDVLHLLRRHGSIELRGKGLHRLHGRLAPLLDGRFTKDQLLASAGPHASMVDRYLERLRETGALSAAPEPRDLPAGFPEPCGGIQHIELDDRRAAVTLAGAEGSRRTPLRISFAPRAEIELRLLDLAKHRPRGRRVWIISDREPDAAEIAKRALVARHLLAIELGRAAGPSLSIFELDRNGLALRRLASVEPPATSLRSVPIQLELVRLHDRPQLPLASMVADLPSCGASAIAYGLDSFYVRAALSVDVLGRAALARAIAGGGLYAWRRELAQPNVRGARVALNVEDGGRALLATSRSACVSLLVCDWARRCRPVHGRSIDLLCVAPPSERVAALQGMLRRRRRTAPAVVDDSSPVVLVRCGGVVLARLGFEEAIAEALLRAVASEVGFEPVAHPFLPPLGDSQSVRRRLRAALATVPPRVPITVGRLTRFACTFFFGIVESAEKGT